LKPSLFVLIGDPFLCEEKRKEIIASLQKKFGPSLTLAIRRVGDVPAETLTAEARTLPFLCEAQILCVRDTDRFTKIDLELLSAYFQSPNTQTQFIFEAESLEKNHPAFQWAKSGGQVFSLAPQRERIAGDFIQNKLKQAQKKITPDALELLESRVGDSFVFLDSLLDQLILYSGERREIDARAVEALDEKLIRFEGFDFLDALAERNLPQALEVLDGLLETNGQDAFSLIGLLHWQIRRFWEAKLRITEGVSERDVASRLKLFPPRDVPFFKSLRRFKLEDLEKILDGLFELDWQLKTGRAQGRTEVEKWLVSAIG